MTKKLMEFKFTPENVPQRLNRILPTFNNAWEKEIKIFTKKSNDVFKKNIPKGKKIRSGRSRHTRDSVTVKLVLRKINTSAQITLSANPKVIGYLDKGTRPSPGRYVPVLGRRLKQNRPNIGIHPGIRGLNIIQKTKDELEMKSDSLIKKLKDQFGISIRKAFT